ncbi:MAG: bifunctional nuclease family protein [Rhabdochlamydiaceae bacterium]
MEHTSIVNASSGSVDYIPVSLVKILNTTHYTGLVVGDCRKQFIIYAENKVGITIKSILKKENRARPSTHELYAGILHNFGIKPLHVLINDVEQNIYFSRIILSHQKNEKTYFLEIDAKPSDAICIALMHEIPLFCEKQVYEKTPPFYRKP